MNENTKDPNFLRKRNKDDRTRVNQQIRASKVRVVLDDGGMLGVMTPYEALREAESRGLDLVEIASTAQPPVCKIMDYGKFKYEQKKKAQSQKKTQAGNVIKEITISPTIDDHDVNFKVRNTIRFFEEGHKVKLMVKFRGRQAAHPEIGFRQIQKFIDMVKDHGVPESPPKKDGRIIIALLMPLPATAQKKKPAAPKSAEGSE